MTEEHDLELGAAGASGRREYERRRAAREARTRAYQAPAPAHAEISGYLLLSEEDALAHAFQPT